MAKSSQTMGDPSGVHALPRGEVPARHDLARLVLQPEGVVVDHVSLVPGKIVVGDFPIVHGRVDQHHLLEEIAMGFVASQLGDAEADHASCGVAHEDDLLVVDVEVCFMLQKEFQTIVAVIDCGGVLVFRSEAVVHVGDDAVGFQSVFAQDRLIRPAICHNPPTAMAKEY